MLDAITFALFKKAFRNLNKPLLINSINGTDCVVELTFEIGTLQYKIVRGIKPEIFEIYVNGVLKNQTGVIDYQEILEKTILKFNFKTFKQIMVLGSKSFKPFMQLPALDRREVIEELLDIQIFSTMAKVTRNKLDHLREELSDLEKNISMTQEKITLQKRNIENNATQNQTKIETNLHLIESGQCSIDTLQTEIESNSYDIKVLQEKIKDFLALNAKHIQFQKLHVQIAQNLVKVKKERDIIGNNDSCPTCHREIDEAFKEKELSNIDIKRKELVEGLSKLEILLDETNTTLTEMIKHQKQITDYQTQIQINLEKIRQLEIWNNKLTQENNDLKQNTQNAETNDAELQQFQKLMGDYIETRKILGKKKKHLETVHTMLKDGGVKAEIIKQYLPKMNYYINLYLSYMDFNSNLTLNSNFEETILARHRDSFAYESFSDGQQLRIDLAILFAWRSVAKLKNSVDTNILILDEVVDRSLDNQGIDDFFKLINTMTDCNIFIISPKGDTLVDKFDHSLKFEMHYDFSSMV